MQLIIALYNQKDTSLYDTLLDNTITSITIIFHAAIRAYWASISKDNRSCIDIDLVAWKGYNCIPIEYHISYGSKPGPMVSIPRGWGGGWTMGGWMADRLTDGQEHMTDGRTIHNKWTKLEDVDGWVDGWMDKCVKLWFCFLEAFIWQEGRQKISRKGSSRASPFQKCSYKIWMKVHTRGWTYNGVWNYIFLFVCCSKIYGPALAFHRPLSSYAFVSGSATKWTCVRTYVRA